MIIGFQVLQTWCRTCAPDGVAEFTSPLTEKDAPEWCNVCGDELLPCTHEWSEWYGHICGGEFRVCDLDGCGEVEFRDDNGNPTERPPIPLRTAFGLRKEP